MAIIVRTLSSQDIDDLAAYFASLPPSGSAGARP
jgi:cytochrome c553